MRSQLIDCLDRDLLKPVYLVSSEEPLLQQEALQKIKQKAQAQGYATTQSLTVDQYFKWDDFFASTLQSDLFSEKQIFILTLHSAKLAVEVGKQLINYLQQTPLDQILVLVTGKLEGATLNSKWVAPIDQNGCILQLVAPLKQNLSQWIKERAKQQSLQLAPDALTSLIEFTEGNLTATAQVIERLALAYGQESIISNEQLRAALFDSTQYTVYDLVDNWLKGEIAYCLKILRRLKQEATEPSFVLWAFTKECRTLAKIQYDLNRHEPLSQVLNTHGVWQKRMPLVKQHLTKKKNYLTLLKEYLLPLELVIKGGAKGNVWDGFERFLMAA